VVGVTERRLVLVAVDREFRPKGDPLSVAPDEVAAASAGGAGHGWWTATESILDSAALTLRLETTSGERRQLTMMRGGGGPVGRLGGGKARQRGIEALAAWLRTAG
jgi:hypothetical protein